MPRTLVRDLAKHVGEQVTVHGWINTLCRQRKIQFVLVRDHTGLVQVTNKRTEPASEVESIFEHGAPLESAVTVVGKVVDNPAVKLGRCGTDPDVSAGGQPRRACLADSAGLRDRSPSGLAVLRS